MANMVNRDRTLLIKNAQGEFFGCNVPGAMKLLRGSWKGLTAVEQLTARGLFDCLHLDPDWENNRMIVLGERGQILQVLRADSACTFEKKTLAKVAT